MKAVAIYARYSSDQQRDASIEDQIRLCQERAAREGWRVRQCYTDHAISGASLIRPGVQALLQDAYAGQFEIILAEGPSTGCPAIRRTLQASTNGCALPMCGSSRFQRAMSASFMSA